MPKLGWILVGASLVATFAISSQSQEIRRVSVFSPLNASEFTANLRSNPNLTNFTASVLDEIPSGGVAATNFGSIVTSVKPDNSQISRRNVVDLNASELDLILNEAAEADADFLPLLSLDLFPETADGPRVSVEFFPRRVTNTSDGITTIIGEVTDSPGSRVVLTKNKSIITGTVTFGGSTYNIRPANGIEANAADAISESPTVIDEITESFPDEADPTSPTDVPSRDAGEDALDIQGELDPAAIPASQIDIAVFYTQEAALAQGGEEPMRLFVDGLIAELNDTLTQSKVPHSFRLVAADTVEYREPADVIKARNEVQSSDDGIVDEIHQKRDEFKADIVVLVVEGSLPICGMAFIPEDINKDYSAYGFAVVVRACAQGNLSFSHEILHLLGVRHDRYRDSTVGSPLPNNHGVTFKCENAYCRDISAYANYCRDVLGVSKEDVSKRCPRVSILGGEDWSLSKEILPGEDQSMSSRSTVRLMGPIIATYR